MNKKLKTIKVKFLINDGIEEEFEVPCLGLSEEEFQAELQRNIDALTERQDEFLKTWETRFPSEVQDRQVFNKLDSEGYYQDGCMVMRKIDLKRAFFEARIDIIEG